MKKTGLLCRVLCLLFAVIMLQIPVYATQSDDLTGVTEPAITESTQGTGKKHDASVEKGCHTIDAKFPLLGTEAEVKNCEAAVLFDMTNQTLMFGWNPDVQIKPSSFAKIMTAWLIAQSGDLSREVTIPGDYVFPYSEASRTSKLQPGETITLESLLYCILVGSSNDACIVAAQYLAGSEDAFVEQMNQQAEAIGCTGTLFSDSTGIDEELQHTTARDVARILAEAMKNETFRTVFCKARYTVPATNMSDARRLLTNNYLVHMDIMERYFDSRVTGGRIAMSSEGKRSIAATAIRNDIEMVSVVVGCASTYTEDGRPRDYGGFDETSDLLDLGYRGFATAQIIYENQALMQYDVINGECDVILCPKESVQVILPYNISRDDLSFRYSSEYEGITAPIKKDARVSAVEVWYKSICIAQADLYAMNEVRVQEKIDLSVHENTAGENGISPLVIIAIIVGILLVLFLGRRFIFRMIYKSRVRRYRKNRRRSR